MEKQMNSISFFGRLGNDCIVKNAGQSEVVEFNVGNTVGYGDKKSTNWFKCTLWGKAGIALEPYLKKGQAVVVAGELSASEYEKKDGTKGFGMNVRVDRIDLAGSSEKSEKPATTGTTGVGFPPVPSGKLPKPANFSEDVKNPREAENSEDMPF